MLTIKNDDESDKRVLPRTMVATPADIDATHSNPLPVSQPREAPVATQNETVHDVRGTQQVNEALILPATTRAPLTVEAIQQAALKVFEETGKWPSAATPGEPPGMKGYKWNALDAAVRNGFRGLPGNQSLAEILTPLKEEFGSKIRGRPLTVEAVRQAALKYFQERGEWPLSHGSEEPHGMPGDSWSTINEAGRHGCRGLPKGETLAKILKPLKECYGSKIHGAPLTVKAIQEAALKYFEETGKWPSSVTPGEPPSIRGDTWSAIDSAGRHGHRGLTKGQTLAKILEPLKRESGSTIEKISLTVEAIQQAALKVFEETGKWPSQHTPGEPPAMHGDTWSAINQAGRHGCRGLPQGHTLATILRPLKELYGSKIHGTPLTVTAIQEAALKYFEETGKWPSLRTPGEPPGLLGDSWSALDAAGREGYREIPKGQTLTKILEPLKTRFSISLGATRLPQCFYDEERSNYLATRGQAKTEDKHVGASFTAIKSVTFAKGEAFEQLAGLLLLSLHEDTQVIPQYCLIVDPTRGYYGMRADYKVGQQVYEVKWGGAADNIKETYEKHKAHLDGTLQYKLLMLCDNADVAVPYSTFKNEVTNTLLEDELNAVRAHLESLVEGDDAERLVQLRDYLHGVVMKGNTLTGQARLEFIAEELSNFLLSDGREAYTSAHRYALYCPLSAHFEYNGNLYASTITPRALQMEKPDQYSTLYTFGRLAFEDPMDRDIAVMCELSTEAGRIEGVLRKRAGLVKEPTFYLPGGVTLTKESLAGRLEQLQQHLHYAGDDFEFGLAYLAYCGSSC